MILTLQILLGLSAAIIIFLLAHSLDREVQEEDFAVPSFKKFFISIGTWIIEGLKSFRFVLFLFFGNVLYFLHKVFHGLSRLLHFSSSKMKKSTETEKGDEENNI